MMNSLAATGAYVSLATSSDFKNPPDSVIDGNPDTFWMTTGLYPQELMIAFPSPTRLSGISTKTANVQKIIIETSNKTEGTEFEKASEKEIPSQDGGQVQVEEHKFDSPQTISRLRLTLAQGYDHFAAVYSIQIIG